MLRKLLKQKSIRNGAWLYALQFFNSVLPMLTLPYVVRILSTEDYGIFSIALNYISYIVVVVEYGFNMTGARRIAISKDPANDNRIFTATVVVRSALCLLCALGVLAFCVIDGFSTLSLCMLVLMLMSVGTVLDQTWFFHGKQDMKYVAIINIISRSVSTILIFLLVKDGGDLIIYCLLYASVNFINGCIGTILLHEKYGVRLQRLTRDQLKFEVTEGWYLFISTFSSKVISALGLTFLGWFATPYDCGVYGALYKIPTILLLVWAPISQVLYPLTSAKMEESFEIGSAFVRKMQNIFMILFIGICACLAVFAKFVVGLLLGENYVAHYQIVYPLLAWLLVAIYNNFSGVQMLLAAGYSKEYSSCIRWSALIATVVNLVGIYFWGINGAAYAPLIAELALTFLLKHRRSVILKTLKQ